MKNSRIAVLLAAGWLVASLLATPAQAANVSFDFFYSNLSPHGSWMVSSSYGNVWQPRVYTTGWNPYYDGRWEYTDIGWTWVSDYGWGAVPYHYGTSVMDPRLGWVWVPGYVWGPSWVVFRSDADYIGWAPVPPSYSVGMSFSSVSIAPSWYVFVPSQSFVTTHVRNVIVPRTQTNVIINRTKIVNNNITIQNNVVVNRGPDVRVVEQRSGRRIQAVPIERVRNVTATGTFSRDEIRVDPARVRGRRVAEPVRGSIEQARAQDRRGETVTADQTTSDRYPRDRRQRDRESAETRNDRRAAPAEATRPSRPPAARPNEAVRVKPRSNANRPSETSTRQEVPPQTTPSEPRIHRRAIPENPPPPNEPPRSRPEHPLPPSPPAGQSPRTEPEDRSSQARSSANHGNPPSRRPSNTRPSGKSTEPPANPAAGPKQGPEKPQDK